MKRYNYQKNLKKKSDADLLEFFGNTDCLNLEPQIYAGNLLYERGYDVDVLNSIKMELLTTLEVNILELRMADPRKLKWKNIFGLGLLQATAATLWYIGFTSTTGEWAFSLWGINKQRLLSLLAILLVLSLLVVGFKKRKGNWGLDEKIEQAIEMRDRVVEGLRF